MRPRFADVSWDMIINVAAILTLVACAIPIAPRAIAQNARPAAAQDAHEGLTVLADPWTEPALYKQHFHKKIPLTAGIAAVYVTFQNDTGDSLRVNLDRIRLLVTISEDNRQDLTPLPPADVADRILSGNSGDPTAKRSRIPIPLSGPKVGRTKEWADLEKAARDAGVSGSVVPPHGRAQGLLFFDMAGQFDMLSTAHLYIPEIVSLEKNKALFYFDIDLAKRVPR